MRIVFFGTPEFAVPSLEALIDLRESVVLVVTQPDRPRGRSRSNLEPSPVKARAESLVIPVSQPVAAAIGAKKPPATTRNWTGAEKAGRRLPTTAVNSAAGKNAIGKWTKNGCRRPSHSTSRSRNGSAERSSALSMPPVMSWNIGAALTPLDALFGAVPGVAELPWACAASALFLS